MGDFRESRFSTSASSGRPRGWVISPIRDFHPVRLQVVLGSPSVFASRAFPETQGRTSGIRRIWVSPIFGVSQGWTSGVAKREFVFWLPLQTDLVAVLKGDIPFRTTSRQTSGGTNSRIPQFCTPPDPLPDFPVHRGHRISTYRLPIDNSLSFPCLDGQC